MNAASTAKHDKSRLPFFRNSRPDQRFGPNLATAYDENRTTHLSLTEAGETAAQDLAETADAEFHDLAKSFAYDPVIIQAVRRSASPRLLSRPFAARRLPVRPCSDAGRHNRAEIESAPRRSRGASIFSASAGANCGVLVAAGSG